MANPYAIRSLSGELSRLGVDYWEMRIACHNPLRIDAFDDFARLFVGLFLVAIALSAGCSDSNEKEPDAASQTHSDASTGEDASFPLIDSGNDEDKSAVSEEPWPDIQPSNSAYLIIYDDALATPAMSLADYRRGTEASVDTLAMSVLLDASESDDASESITSAIRAWTVGFDRTRAKSVLLFGDAEAIPPAEIAGRSSTVGPFITSDNLFADLDHDSIPDLAVGRIPVRTEQEAEIILLKIFTHESVYEPGPWNKRISLFASEGNFGEAVDQAIENVTLQILDPLDNAYDVTMTYGSQRSAFVFPPERLSDKVYQRMNEGSFFMGYLGHGYQAGFAKMSWNGGSYPIFNTDQLDQLTIEHHVPILAFIACSNAAFDAEQDSISERILKQPGASSAIFASTEVSHPYANTLLAREVALTLLESDHRPQTVGELFLRAKQTAVSNIDAARQAIDALAASLLAGDDPDILLEEALQMYVLLGDPAMRLVYPPYRAAVQIDKRRYRPGETISISVDTGGLESGKAIITLESPRSVNLKPILPIPPDDDPTRDRVIEQNYENANDKVIESLRLDFSQGTITTTIGLDKDLPTDTVYYLKVLATGKHRDAIGVTEIALNFE